MEIIIEHFKTIFDRPEKIKKLREAILDLAVRGKLVPQDPTDEPARALLEKIKEEKEHLIKGKKIKKEKLLAEINNEEKRRNLKNGWVWARIGNLGLTQTGTTPSTKKSEFFNGNVPFIKPADLSLNGINYNNESLTKLGLENGRLIKENSVMMVCIGGSIGKCYYTDRDTSCNQQINAITPLGNISSKFLYYILSSSDFYTTMINLATGSATPIINKSKWENILIPIPPLNEQKRITKKIDLLMALCDKLEEYLEKKIHYSMLSAKSVFNSIGMTSTAEELEETLKFIIKNFKELSLGDNAIKELKNCILQLAVQGKLIPQNPTDESASVLLEQIKEQKEKLITEKIIKREKPLPEIREEENPFKIPNGWILSRLQNISYKITDGSHNPPKNKGKGYPMLSAKNIDNWKLDFKNIDRYINEDEFIKENSRTDISENDVLLSIVGSIGKTCVVDTNKKFTLQRSVAVLKTGIYSEYLMYALSSPVILNQMLIKAKGTAQLGIYLGTVRSLVLPIPPLNEQRRIIKKVKQLIQLCDILEKKIECSNKYNLDLMNSITNQLCKV